MAASAPTFRSHQCGDAGYRIVGPKNVFDWVSCGQIPLIGSEAQAKNFLKFQKLRKILRVTQRV